MKYKLGKRTTEGYIQALMFNKLTNLGFIVDVEYKVPCLYHTRKYDRFDLVLHDNLDVYCIIECKSSKKTSYCDWIDLKNPPTKQLFRYSLHKLPIFYVTQLGLVDLAVNAIYARFSSKLNSTQIITSNSGKTFAQQTTIEPDLLKDIMDGNI